MKYTKEELGKFQFLIGFLATMLALAVLSRWAGSIWQAVLIALGIAVAFTLLILWLYFRLRKQKSTEQYHFNFKD